MLGQELQSDYTAQPGVVGSVHDAHAPGSERLVYGIRPHALAGHSYTVPPPQQNLYYPLPARHTCVVSRCPWAGWARFELLPLARLVPLNMRNVPLRAGRKKAAG